MFTGIVEERGAVVDVTRGAASAQLVVRGPLVAEGLRDGDSVAVNGVCLTVTSVRDDASFTFDVMAATLDRSSLGGLDVGDPVNLERPLRADGRFGGHIVQGHVDGVGVVRARTPVERAEVVRVSLPKDLARYVVPQGSIAVDGVSLTVVEVADDWFTVSLIPATLAATTLGERAVGDRVNLEVDVLGKYVEKMVRT